MPATEPERSAEGKFVSGVSGNPLGRPKGSKNRVTLMKIMAEEAVRDSNFDKMMEVCRSIIEAAMEGDNTCRKLVWESVMTKGTAPDDAKVKEKVTINIGSAGRPPTPVIEGEVVTIEPEDDPQ